MEMPPRSLSVILLLVAAIGCGNDDSGTTGQEGGTGGAGGTSGASTGAQGGTSSGTWQQRCQTVVDHNASCGKSSADTAAVTDCMATEACVPSAWAADVVDTVMTCLSTLACDSPDDDCISMTASQQTDVKMAMFTACEDKAATCTNFGGCPETAFLISDELAATLTACLDQPCDAASACLSSEYAAAITAAGCTGELPFGG